MIAVDELLVTVLVPVWNEEKHIRESVKSVLEQTHDNLELFLIDDGSDDETLEIIQSLASSDPRIKPLRNPRKGKVAAINYAFEKSQGKLFVYFAGDDIMPAKSIEYRVKYFCDCERSFSEPYVGYGQLQMMSDDKNFDGHRLPPSGNKGTISGGTIVFNRQFAEKMYPVPESLPNEDTWARLCAEHFSPDLIDIPHVVLKYRIHDGNSHNRYVPFAEMNEFLHKRYIAFEMFRDKFANELKPSQIEHLSEKANVEKWRHEGKWWKILSSRLSLEEKFRTLLNSRSLFYRLKLKLSRLF